MKTEQVFNNAKWIIVCKVFQSLLQLAVGMLSARYLGPSNYGLINYAVSITAFVIPFMRLGLDATMVHEFIRTPDKEGEIAGTSLLMNVASSILGIFGVIAFASIANPGDKEVIIVCALYSISLFFGALEMIQYWFQYKLMSKYSSIVMLVSYVFVSVYKIFLLVASKSVYWFALTNSLDFGIIGISLIIIYKQKKGQPFSFSLKRAKDMLGRSKHYLFASVMVVVIHNTDHIMLTNMIGKAENGFYSAAITTVTVVQFVYTAIIDSYRPLILSNKSDDEKAYTEHLAELYGVIIYLTVLQSVFFTVFAKYIVGILYGSDYSASVPIVQVLVWYLTFSVMGSVRNVWMLAEGKQKYLWIINSSGALFNIILNAVMIPYLGAVGAALASALTQFFANFVLGFILPAIRTNNAIIIQSLRPKYFWSFIKNMLAVRKKHI